MAEHKDSHAKKVHAEPHASHPPHEEGEQWLISYADLMTLLVGFFVILLSFSSVDEEKMEELKKAITKEFGGAYEVPFGDLAETIRTELKKLGVGDQFVIKTNPNGVDISFQGTVFFETGSVDLKPEGVTLLTELVPVIKAEAGAFDITVEGHTDDVPVSAGALYKNNWELSSVRACRVLDQFEQAGFLKKNLMAVGYGETRPIVPNRDTDGVDLPENQSQNRRVVIRLIKSEQNPLGTDPNKSSSHKDQKEPVKNSHNQEGSHSNETSQHI